MRSKGQVALLCVLCAGAGGATAYALLRPAAPAYPDSPAVVERVRAVARLEALEVTLYRKVSFEPHPGPASDLWGELTSWARHTLRQPRGRAIVFGRAHLSYDLGKLAPGQLRVEGPQAELVLPPLEVVVELLPAETEVIGSNLDTRETAELMELAKRALERDVRGDASLRARAEASAERTLRALLLELGFRQARVVTSSSS